MKSRGAINQRIYWLKQSNQKILLVNLIFVHFKGNMWKSFGRIDYTGSQFLDSENNFDGS